MMKYTKLNKESLRMFWYENRFLLAALFLFLLLFYGGRIFHANISIDSEYLYNHPDSYYNWMSLGRFGQCFTKWLLHMGWYTPYFQNIVFLLAIWGFSGIMCYLIDSFGILNSRWPLFLFCAMALTHPVLAEQTYFIMQRAEIGMAYVYTALALVFSFSWVNEKKWYHAVCAIFFATLAFATYQTFVVMYITGVAACFLLYSFVTENARACRKGALQLSALFAGSLGSYLILQKLLCHSSGYLGSMVAWTNTPSRTCIRHILDHFIDLLISNSLYYSPLQGILILLTLGLSLRLLFLPHCDWSKKLLCCGAAGIVSISPILLTMVLGAESMKRSELMLPFALASMMLLCLCYLQRSCNQAKTAGSILITCLAIALLWTQGQTSQRLFYTDDVRQRSDERLASQISMEIDQINSGDHAVVFIGNRPATLDETCMVGESIGLSFFDIFYGNAPYYYHSTVRILDFMWAQGYPYPVPTEEQVLKARQNALHMPCWPKDGSVQIYDDIVIVKLSPDLEYGQ